MFIYNYTIHAICYKHKNCNKMCINCKYHNITDYIMKNYSVSYI